MAVNVRIPTQLRELSGGESEVDVEGATVAEVLKQLEARHPGFAARLFDDKGQLRRFVNVRPYYAEGSKTLAFETAEQLGWEVPDHVVVPVASGSLLTKVRKGFDELHQVGLLDTPPRVRVSGAQAEG